MGANIGNRDPAVPTVLPLMATLLVRTSWEHIFNRVIFIEIILELNICSVLIVTHNGKIITFSKIIYQLFNIDAFMTVTNIYLLTIYFIFYTICLHFLFSLPYLIIYLLNICPTFYTFIYVFSSESLITSLIFIKINLSPWNIGLSGWVSNKSTIQYPSDCGTAWIPKKNMCFDSPASNKTERTFY